MLIKSTSINTLIWNFFYIKKKINKVIKNRLKIFHLFEYQQLYLLIYLVIYLFFLNKMIIIY